MFEIALGVVETVASETICWEDLSSFYNLRGD